ncbi:MAG TPA: PD-(D/E)XK nuclease-like domain-containing protein [Dissulfurispiraceae bacterium]|nr:PD-(D/E)XK nuclease-like domain-containing protein [Dissulfurispiraceae bacterium]
MTTLPAPTPGLHQGVPFETYCQWPAVNNSLLRILAEKSPAHARYYAEAGREETPALAFGKAADAFILEPSRFFERYAVAPTVDRRTREGKAEWAAFEEGLGSREYISEADYAKIQAIYMRVVDSQAMRLIEGGVAQVCAVWTDKPTGLLCKARFDYWREDIPMITDLKTTLSCKPDDFAKSIFNYGYYQQAGFYAMGAAALTGCDAPCFAVLAVEKDEPFVHAAYDLGLKTIDAGRLAARAALTKYAECMESGRWPSYSEKITTLDMPEWALLQCGVNKYQI